MHSLLDKVRGYLPGDRAGMIERALDFAAAAHEGQKRKSGEDYIEHPISVAEYLADLNLDAPTIAAALLHDVIEDCNVTTDDLRKEFGEDVAKLADGVTKLARMDTITGDAEPLVARTDSEAESLRKMLVAMANDIRVILIKLADRMHNMRTLEALPPDRRVAIAQETLDIYAPLAHRLGMGEVKWQLEDLAFRYIQPNQYRSISGLLATKRAERESYVEQVTGVLRDELAKAGFDAEVTGRPKHIYSIHRKAQSYAAQGKQMSEIYDLFAVRVLVNTVQDCYGVLGLVHSLWHPVPGQFDDYVANPKENMYQSLHTTVRSIDGLPVEVQVRTHEMHRISEYGVASHWSYKEGGARGSRFEERMTWLRQLLEWQRDVSGTDEFLENVTGDLFGDQVFVYTPKNEIRELPAGATPIDFAYRIHTQIGHKCIGAKVNGRLVALNTPLKNGDTVEVLTSKVARGPSLDWLNPHLDYVKTASARQAIRSWFRHQERGTNIERGRAILKKELKRLSAQVDEAEVARWFQYDSMDDLYAAIGSGIVSVAQIAGRLSAAQAAAERALPREAPDAPRGARPRQRQRPRRRRPPHPHGRVLQPAPRRPHRGLHHPHARRHRPQGGLPQRPQRHRDGPHRAGDVGPEPQRLPRTHRHRVLRPRRPAARHHRGDLRRAREHRRLRHRARGRRHGRHPSQRAGGEHRAALAPLHPHRGRARRPRRQPHRPQTPTQTHPPQRPPPRRTAQPLATGLPRGTAPLAATARPRPAAPAAPRAASPPRPPATSASPRRSCEGRNLASSPSFPRKRESRGARQRTGGAWHGPPDPLSLQRERARVRVLAAPHVRGTHQDTPPTLIPPWPHRDTAVIAFWPHADTAIPPP